MMDKLRLWFARHPVMFITVNVWASVWTANVVTTWAQTVLIQADNHNSSAESVARWGKARKEWAVRLDGLEAQCARR